MGYDFGVCMNHIAHLGFVIIKIVSPKTLIEAITLGGTKSCSDTEVVLKLYTHIIDNPWQYIVVKLKKVHRKYTSCGDYLKNQFSSTISEYILSGSDRTHWHRLHRKYKCKYKEN